MGAESIVCRILQEAWEGACLGAIVGYVELCLLASHEGYEFIIDDLHQLLVWPCTLHHLCTERLFLQALDELAHCGQTDLQSA